MHHEATLIATIAIAFVLAFGFGYVADRLRLPPLVGYLVAGVLIGPYTPGFVADAGLSSQLAEVGVILLMFGVGLHFSASDLLAVKGIAIPGAIGQIVLATLLGIGLCSLWGWSVGTGLVIGLSLSVASTVVLLKALEERNMVDSPNGRVAVGWLIVEDLAMVLALVLLPAFAEVLGGKPIQGHAPSDMPIALELAITLAKVGAFAAIAILIGPKVVPWMLARVARTGSRELFTLSVLAVALGIAYGSAHIFGVSFALGAFFAGVVLSESSFSHKAAADSLPLQDAFSVLFFVSVGMLFDPTILYRSPGAVLSVLALIIFGKSLIAFAIIMLLRYPIGTGLVVSASLAQIGEFSFILIALGISAGLVPNEGRDLVVGGALFSIMLNPLVFYAVGLLQRRVAQPAGTAFYGQRHYEALGRQLAIIKARQAERSKAEDLKLSKLLELFPMLQLVERQDQESLLLMFRPKPASPGDRVIRAGDRADGMYFISSGAVEVHVAHRVIRLEAGAYFGEMALLTGERRTADVIAVDFCQFLVLDRRDFNQFMARHPGVRAAVASIAEERQAMNLAPPQADGRDMPDGAGDVRT
ncbi:cation:proton antiporter [Reyranella sp.]|uniref:cation:proton antiporter domain-containing protein n=1 Tax=Reyranella sp. TaxID=1929291 RepID=UPI003BAC7526